jgi:hypothetical protein
VVMCHCSRGGFHRHLVSGLSSRRDGANGRRSHHRARTRCVVGKQMDDGAGRGEKKGARRRRWGRREGAGSGGARRGRVGADRIGSQDCRCGTGERLTRGKMRCRRCGAPGQGWEADARAGRRADSRQRKKSTPVHSFYE